MRWLGCLTWSLGLVGDQAADEVGVGAPQVGHQLAEIILDPIGEG